MTLWRKLTPKSLVAAVVLLAVATRLRFAFIKAMLPFELDYEEGNVLNAAYRILHHQTPYPDPGSFPYTLNPYGPVGYSLAAFGLKILGLSFFGPRLLVFIAGLLILLLIARLTVSFGGYREIGVLFGCLFICSPLLRLWFPLLRVDLWAILWSLFGLYIFSVRPRLWWLACALFVIALLTKPTAIAAPAACVMELLLRRRLREAARFVVGITMALVICGLGLGSNFMFALLRTHPDPYSLKRALHLYLLGLENMQLVLAIVICSVALGFRWNERSRLAWLYLAICSVTPLSAGKLGSETNHFLEWAAAVSISGGLAISYLLESYRRLGQAFAIGVAALTIVFALGPRYSLAAEAQPQGCLEAYNFMRSFPGNRVLSEDTASLVLSAKPVLVSNPFVTTQLGNSVAWSNGSMGELVRNQFFDLIVLGGDVQHYQPESGRWPLSVISGVGEHYREERRFQCFPHFVVAYVPKAKVGHTYP
jgi:hypothetical protein